MARKEIKKEVEMSQHEDAESSADMEEVNALFQDLESTED